MIIENISRNEVDEMKQVRSGLRIRYLGIDDDVRMAILNFANWLRRQIKFPIRVVVYVKSDKQVKNIYGEFVYGTFFAPDDKSVEPYIRVATGDYFNLKEELGRDDALAAILHTLAHEVVHYEQWLKEDNCFDERKANYRATRLVHKYAETRDHP